MKVFKDTHTLFIDDLSEAEAIELKKQLVSDPVQRPYPLNFHERKQKILPLEKSILHQNLTKIEDYTINNQMKINEKKSKIMMFNKSRNLDRPPEFSFKNGELIECVDETRLLGIQIHKSLRWDSNCLNMFKRSMSKMWLLRRMKSIKLEKSIILEYYLKEIRP